VNLRTLSLTQLLSDPALVDQLVASGDSLLVERAGPPRAAAAVASLANTLGGWVVVEGGAAPDLTVDPPAPYAHATVDVGGRHIQIIRVAASGDTPHLTRSGRVLVRGHDGTEPADDATLRMLVARGDDGVAGAAARLHDLPLIEEAMRTPERLPGDAPILDPDHMGHDAPLELIVRAAPVTITRTLAARVLTQEGADLAAAQAIPLLVDPDAVAHRVATRVEGRARGVYCAAERGEAPIFADLAIDAGGVVAARLAERRQRDGTVSAAAVVDEVLLPLLRTVSGTLDGLDATGRALLELEIRGATDLVVEWTPELTDVVHIDELLDDDRLVLGGELALPADADDLRRLAERWARGLARAAGLPAWEPS
jgi:hypothetical protein